ncbi:hypothetical protein TNCV_1406641 [Trichonephila clavipes]|nr:hypothetical protein TNCV_1406641 [Trichonephila clavipes]
MTVGIILRSCTKVPDLAVEECWSIGDDFILMDDNSRPHRKQPRGGFLFRGRNRTNGMTSVFSRHESNRKRLGRSRKTNGWPPTTPTNSPRTGKSCSGSVGKNTSTRD